MTLAATTGNMEGFLCQARQNKDDGNTKVGMLSASSGMTMKEPCGSVRNLRLLKPLIGLGISIKNDTIQFVWSTGIIEGTAGQIIDFRCYLS